MYKPSEITPYKRHQQKPRNIEKNNNNWQYMNDELKNNSLTTKTVSWAQLAVFSLRAQLHNAFFLAIATQQTENETWISQDLRQNVCLEDQTTVPFLKISSKEQTAVTKNS